MRPTDRTLCADCQHNPKNAPPVDFSNPDLQAILGHLFHCRECYQKPASGYEKVV